MTTKPNTIFYDISFIALKEIHCVFFSLTRSPLILHTENSVHGLSFHDLIKPNLNRYLILSRNVATKSILKYLQCCDKYLISCWMMNEYNTQLFFFSLLLRVDEILDVVASCETTVYVYRCQINVEWCVHSCSVCRSYGWSECVCVWERDDWLVAPI